MATEASIRSYVEKHVLPKHQDVDEEDAVTLLALLVETGILDSSRITNVATLPTKYHLKLDKNVDFECKGSPRTKGSIRKRITYLRLGGWASGGYDFHTEAVFALLSKLDCLEVLCPCRCKNFRFADTIVRFPKLKHLDAVCFNWGETRIGSLDLLREMGESNLESLELGSFGIWNEDELATFLFDVFPYFPKLKKFRVSRNKVETYQGIARRIRNNNDNEAQKAKNSRLRCLNLCNYRGKKGYLHGTNDPKEVEAIKTILLAFRELNDIAGLWSNESSRELHDFLNPGISYQMEINFTGRILVESKQEEECIHSPIPLSIWPIVLTRTWKQEPHRWSFSSGGIHRFSNFMNPDGIYYLLRNVRVLQEGNNRSHSRGNGDSNNKTSSG